ncbi:MAG: hypothetical protein KGP28_09435 [Bdellovibrionales bacterium]|nr:hypothetical protein [Bdellovibrionales bacterium]
MKRKEKPLTIEEIKTKLTLENAGNWIHSEPHFSLISTPEGIRILPLSSKAETEILLLFFVDLTRYSSETVLEAIDRLHQEYKGLPWRPVLIIEPKYLFLRDSLFFDRFRSFKSFASTAILLDTKGEWFEHFNASEGRILLLHRGMEILQTPILPEVSNQLSKIEHALQDGLRLEDPGLPLYRVRPQNFTHVPDLQVITPRELTTTGTWATTPTSIVSEDSNAQVSFYFEGTRLRFVANSHPNSREHTRFILTLNQEPLASSHYGSNTKLGEKGSSVSEIGKSHGIYELISSTTPLRGEIRINFLNAVENPVIVYGFRTA